MTNTELLQKFRELTTLERNVFDVYTTILEPKFVNAYEQTAFYAATKQSVVEAYETYMRNGGKIDAIINIISEGDFTKMFSMIEGFQDHFDFEAILNSISPENKELLEQYTSMMK